jgi:hypothetical protein
LQLILKDHKSAPRFIVSGHSCCRDMNDFER